MRHCRTYESFTCMFTCWPMISSECRIKFWPNCRHIGRKTKWTFNIFHLGSDSGHETRVTLKVLDKKFRSTFPAIERPSGYDERFKRSIDGPLESLAEASRSKCNKTIRQVRPSISAYWSTNSRHYSIASTLLRCLVDYERKSSIIYSIKKSVAADRMQLP